MRCCAGVSGAWQCGVVALGARGLALRHVMRNWRSGRTVYEPHSAPLNSPSFALQPRWLLHSCSRGLLSLRPQQLQISHTLSLITMDFKSVSIAPITKANKLPPHLAPQPENHKNYCLRCIRAWGDKDASWTVIERGCHRETTHGKCQRCRKGRHDCLGVSFACSSAALSLLTGC